MSTLVILRGIPGAGKSTMAKKMMEELKAQGLTVEMYEADMFFEQDGQYNFDPSKLGEAHGWCQQQVKNALQNCDVVIVSNTSLSEWEMQPYIEAAKEAGADVKVYHLKSNYGSIHGVPEEAIAKMREREIDWPGETVIN